MEMVKKDGIRQNISVQLQRADYMSHWDEQQHKMELKNVWNYFLKIKKIIGIKTTRQMINLFKWGLVYPLL